MISDYENGDFEVIGGQRPYALGLNHKHLPEMKHVLKLNKSPIFTPSVGNFKQGMLVISYLVKKDLKKNISREDLRASYSSTSTTNGSSSLIIPAPISPSNKSMSYDNTFSSTRVSFSSRRKKE